MPVRSCTNYLGIISAQMGDVKILTSPRWPATDPLQFPRFPLLYSFDSPLALTNLGFCASEANCKQVLCGLYNIVCIVKVIMVYTNSVTKRLLAPLPPLFERYTAISFYSIKSILTSFLMKNQKKG